MPDIKWPENMASEQREAMHELLGSLDAAATALEGNTQVIFSSEQERKGKFYGAIAKWGRAWAKPGRCMYPGCTNKSIARSHTISLGTSIEQISEDGHVLTPKYGEGRIELIRIGKREASTFPGFCEEHELLFADFENQRSLSVDRHFGLQVFRTLCREIYSKRQSQQKLTDMLADYRNLREAYLRRSIALPDGRAGEPVTINGITFENDAVEEQMIKLLELGSHDLAELDELYEGIIEDLRAGTSNVAINIEQIDFELPVCLSGLGVLNYRQEGTDNRCLCCIAILPESNGTKILLAVAAEHSSVAALHLHKQDSPAVLARLESWMLNGSDHWFIRPSSWATIPPARQHAICERIPVAGDLIENPPFSILDSARRRIIAGLEDALNRHQFSPEDEPRAREVLAREQDKLDYSGS